MSKFKLVIDATFEAEDFKEAVGKIESRFRLTPSEKDDDSYLQLEGSIQVSDVEEESQ